MGKSFVPQMFFRSSDEVIYCPLKLILDGTEHQIINKLKLDLMHFLELYRLNIPVQFDSWSGLFAFLKFLFHHFNKEPLILHLDEFQEIRRFKGVEGMLASFVDLWREGKSDDCGGMLLTGSFWRHIEPMFQSKESPLFGRETHRLVLSPWRPSTLINLLEGSNQNRAQDLLSAYAFTGGVPWYLELMNRGGFLKNTHQKCWEFVKEVYVLGALRREEIDVIDKHLRGDAVQLMEGVLQGRTKRTQYKDLISTTHFQNFRRFIGSINENYHFVDLIKDPILPDQSGTECVRIQDPFLYFVFTLGRKLLEYPLEFLDAARDQIFTKNWHRHEGWALEEILYRLIGENAAILSFKVDYRNFGFKVTIPGQCEMDLLSFSAEEKWIELTECKRSLQKDFDYETEMLKKKKALLKQLKKRFPDKNISSWDFSCKIVYAYNNKSYSHKSKNIQLINLNNLIENLQK